MSRVTQYADDLLREMARDLQELLNELPATIADLEARGLFVQAADFRGMERPARAQLADILTELAERAAHYARQEATA